MAIAATGAVSMSDLRTEFVGGSAAIPFSDLYRGGNIRAKVANNMATNLAASVPTSGAINYTNFRSTAKGFRKTYSYSNQPRRIIGFWRRLRRRLTPRNRHQLRRSNSKGAASTSQEALSRSTAVCQMAR